MLHDKNNPKDCQVLSLGDSGFLQFFRVVSSDEMANPDSCGTNKQFPRKDLEKFFGRKLWRFVKIYFKQSRQTLLVKQIDLDAFLGEMDVMATREFLDALQVKESMESQPKNAFQNIFK